MAFVKLADNYTDLIGKFAVALLAEGVDRNSCCLLLFLRSHVALLAEGVDRNSFPTTLSPVPQRSPSSRRAWIEIMTYGITMPQHFSRPPRGGRG